jgi:hypothetical protein
VKVKFQLFNQFNPKFTNYNYSYNSKCQWKLVKAVKVNFLTVQPINTKIYKLQLQITVITVNCGKCQWKLVKAVKVKFQLFNQFKPKFTNYN